MSRASRRGHADFLAFELGHCFNRRFVGDDDLVIGAPPLFLDYPP
jgi:hypothetical protein